MKSIRKGFGIAAGAGLIVLVAAAPALAHPKVVARTPEDGSTVAQPPSEVSVEFDEAVTNADLNVFDPCGDQVDNGNPDVFLQTVTVGMSADRAGTYSVRWEVISEDGHNVSGGWTFTSSGGSACPGSGGGDDNGGNTGGAGGDRSGGGNDSGGNSSTTTASGGDDPAVSTDGSGGGDENGTGGKNKEQNGKDKKNKNSKHDHPKKDEPREVDLVAGGDDGGGSSDMPVDWLLISFGIAALIGAAGGSIYASIVGPR